MKKTIAIVSMFVMMIGCDSDNNIINIIDVQQVQNIAKVGIWRIVSYIDSGIDKTSDYTGYNFEFVDNGIVTAAKGTDTVLGTWSVTNSSSSGSEVIDFNLSFVSPSNFLKLSDDWDLVSLNNATIDLIDQNGGVTDMLTFKKN